jgi:hypothetical protein
MRKAKYLQFICTNCMRTTFVDNKGQAVYPGELIEETKLDCPVCAAKTAHYVSGANAEDKRDARGEPATERQLNYIRKLGEEPPETLTKREASRMIDRLTGKIIEPRQSEVDRGPPQPVASASVSPEGKSGCAVLSGLMIAAYFIF